MRVWERRYGFPRPLCTAGGERLYPQEQVTKLRMVKRNDFNPVCHPFRHHRTRRFAQGAYVIRGDMGGRRQPRARRKLPAGVKYVEGLESVEEAVAVWLRGAML